MTIGVVNVTDSRDRSGARFLAWVALSLALHLVVTQLRARLVFEPLLELIIPEASELPLLREIPVDLGPEPNVPKEPSLRAEPVKSTAATFVAPHDASAKRADGEQMAAGQTAPVVATSKPDTTATHAREVN